MQTLYQKNDYNFLRKLEDWLEPELAEEDGAPPKIDPRPVGAENGRVAGEGINLTRPGINLTRPGINYTRSGINLAL